MPPADLDQRLQLLQRHRDATMLMLSSGLAAGFAIEDIVAVVADTRDSVGGALAHAMEERPGAVDADEEGARSGAVEKTPTLVACLTTSVAVGIFSVSNPSVSAGLSRPPGAGRVRVVVVGAGGSTLVHLPIAGVRTAGAA
jgi:hypothetical protein